MTENNDSITLGPGFQAFAKGVMAGEEASKDFQDVDTDKRAERLAWFWLKVGAQLAASVPDADDDAQLQFIAGAATRAPNPPAVSVTIDSLGGAAFGHGPDDESFDEYECRAEIARVLNRAAARIADGADDGPLKDTNGGSKIGRYSVNLWQ